MSSIYTIQREQHFVNINQITKDEINKYIDNTKDIVFDIKTKNEIQDYLFEHISNNPNKLELLNMINLNGFTETNIKYISRKIKNLTEKSKRSTVIFREKNILDFLRLYYDSYNGTLVDKLQLFEYCLSKDIILTIIGSYSINTAVSILSKWYSEGYSNLTEYELNQLGHCCVCHILHNRYNEIISNDITILKTMIEKQKNDTIELKYKLYYISNITEIAICKMITDYAFPSLEKTIKLQPITRYEVLLED